MNGRHRCTSRDNVKNPCAIVPPMGVVFAKASSGITTAGDLEGKKIGIPGRYGSSWIMLQALLDSAGLTAEDVEIVEYPDFGQGVAVPQPQRVAGRSVGRVWSFRDITERKRAAGSLAQQAAAMKASMESSSVRSTLDTRGSS